jgi:hypothetical protein
MFEGNTSILFFANSERIQNGEVQASVDVKGSNSMCKPILPCNIGLRGLLRQSRTTVV